jgi:adenylate cyclase
VSGQQPGAIAFTDIVGFTEFTAERGDSGALAVLDLQERVVREALPPNARVVKELGDGMMLWFPDAGTGVATCLEVHERLDAEASDELPLWVRMGMHWGCPTPRGDDLIGNDVNLAARIVDMAGPGELLVSDPVRAQVGDGRGVRFEELGPVVMKGIRQPVGLFRVSRD